MSWGVAFSEPPSLVRAEGMAMFSDLAKEPLSHAHSRPGGINQSRCVQNYISESLVGVMTKIWRSTASGPYDKVIQRSVMIRYLVMLSIELGL